MSIAAYHQAIEGFFNTQWGATTPIAWPNTAYTAPNNTAYVRPIIQTFERFNASHGTSHQRALGALVVHVYTPINTGSQTLYTIEAALETALSNQTTNGVRFEVVECISRNQRIDDGPTAWSRSIYRVNFRYDEAA